MRYLLITAFLFTCAVFQASGQSEIHPVIHDLLSHPEPIDDIFHGVGKPTPFFPLPDSPNRHIRDAFQYLLRTEAGLFLVPDGTGRLYQILPNEKGVQLVRQDSTVYYGYNYGQDLFTYQDTLFSIGGVGFWRVNGHLRHYSVARREWEVEKLNMELPLTRANSLNTFHWLDRKNGNYYRAGVNLHAPALRTSRNENAFDDRVVVLHLPTRTWTELGRIKARVGYRVCSTPWGELTIDDEGQITGNLLHFPSNRRWRVRPEKVKMIYSHSNNPYGTTTLIYYRDSTLHIGRMDPPALFTIPLIRSDFTVTDEPIYQPSGSLRVILSDSTAFRIALGIIPFLLAGVLVFLYQHRKKKGTKEESPSAFTSRERTMLDLIARNADKNFSSTIDELNDVLGLRDKSIDIQKKHRSDLVLSINEKHRLITGTETLLITKERTTSDKRSYLYCLNMDLYRKIQK